MTLKLQPWQASTLIGICGVFAVGATLAFTNPHRQAYQSYASRQLREYLQDNVCTSAFREFLHKVAARANVLQPLDIRRVR